MWVFTFPKMVCWFGIPLVHGSPFLGEKVGQRIFFCNVATFLKIDKLKIFSVVQGVPHLALALH